VIVVSDTGPLNYLIIIGHVEIIPQLFDKVLVPTAVVTEMCHPAAPKVVRDFASALPKWIEVHTPTKNDPKLEFLGEGEKEAILLAAERKADLVLIDERIGRHEAENAGLRVAGTLAVLEEAGQQGFVDLDRALEALDSTSFRVSPELMSRMRSKVKRS
jgi:predicted nucleic acid-binding protein